MSNERIDQIIREHINISCKTNLEHIRRTRNAMEQYGKEQYSEGYNAAYIEDGRLRSLVQAQKELIEYITGAWNDPIKYAMTREALEQKIKSLEA